MYLPYNKNSICKAKILRRNQTPEEKKLWYQYLSSYPVRFLRQRTIDSYILDFYCAKCKFGIELDGQHHMQDNIVEYDIIRTELLAYYGVTIIRFSNTQIRNEFGKVCRCIDQKVKEMLH